MDCNDGQRRMLRDSAQNFLSERAPVSQLRALRDGTMPIGHSPALWRAFGAAGLQRHAGAGGASAASGSAWPKRALIAEQIGHTLAPSPYFSTRCCRHGC